MSTEERLRELVETRIVHLKANSEHWRDINERLKSGETVIVESATGNPLESEITFLEKVRAALLAASPAQQPVSEGPAMPPNFNEVQYWRRAYEQLLDYVKSENSCSVCRKFANPLYMCDEDTADNKYCAECFKKVGCEKRHGEGCMTKVYGEWPQEPLAASTPTSRLSEPSPIMLQTNVATGFEPPWDLANWIATGDIKAKLITTKRENEDDEETVAFVFGPTLEAQEQTARFIVDTVNAALGAVEGRNSRLVAHIPGPDCALHGAHRADECGRAAPPAKGTQGLEGKNIDEK